MNLISRLPTGAKPIDDLLGGGIETGTVTQIYGEPASGKTNICMQLAINTLRTGKRVIYIDTEGFSVERFSQIAGEDAHELARQVIIFTPLSFEEQFAAIKDAEKLIGQNVGLVILDSATAFYRIEREGKDGIRPMQELASQVTALLGMARKHGIPVVITNQIYTDIGSEEFRATGGKWLEHISKAIVELKRNGPGKRIAVLRKHRSLPEGITAEFTITGKGVE
ncbi:DNA repair and recombination protein RadB [Methanocella arvoryzae]|uniref:DNA repair and recombination protein RadB n=1 Tax=Methanocella arvoryzae TaxID=1175445 RepID=UPI00032278EC|nr:DNA repair and recombination protein RadB [Methanocella arvoryzae]